MAGFSTGSLQADVLLGGAGGLPGMPMTGFSAPPTSAGLYGGYNAQMAAAVQRHMAPPAPAFQQPNGRYAAGPSGGRLFCVMCFAWPHALLGDADSPGESSLNCPLTHTVSA
jgi:hypothetical protein